MNPRKPRVTCVELQVLAEKCRKRDRRGQGVPFYEELADKLEDTVFEMELLNQDLERLREMKANIHALVVKT